MVPPIGSMIIGPCPQCEEMVVVFCGQVLALDKELMQNGDLDDRREHLMSVLTEFLRDRVGKLLSEEAPAQDEDGEEVSGLVVDDTDSIAAQASEEETGPISEAEFQRFSSVDLKLLDNDAYFRSVFDQK